VVTICTTSLTSTNSFCPHSVFMCCVWIWEQTAIISLYSINWLGLGAFAKQRKATISFVVSVRPSVRIEQLGSHWTDFHYIWHLCIFRKSVEKIQVSLKSDKNNGTLHEDRYVFLIISRLILLRMRNVSDKSCWENQKTRIMFKNFIFENRAVYEMWKNTVLRGRPQMAIWRMRIAYWITTATYTHSEYVILIAFHYNNGYTNAPQRYVIRTMTVLL